MAGVISVPANEGKSVKNECSDPKTNAMTIQSIKGLYSWKSIAGYHVPCITRVIDGEELKFVSVRMAETELLSNYLHQLHADIYTYASVRSYFITDSEAKLLNEINIEHSDGIYGKDTFYAGKDYIVRLEDVIEFYIFIKVCYNKVLCNITPGRIEKCGFIYINTEYVVPYCLKDGCKYLPLFYFEGETECERQRPVILQDWNLAYIKFCCKVQGIDNELYNFDSCTATTLDVIKNFFPPETRYEEYWPAKAKKLQINQKSTHVHPSGIWIKAPPEVHAPESTIPHSLTASAPVMRQSMPVVMNTIQNGWPPNQLGPQMSQGNSLMNGGTHVISPPPLDRANNTAPAISNTVSYSNTVPISQCMTTMYNPVRSSSVVSHSNQTQQFYNQRPSNNSQAQQQQVQQHQQQLQIQQQPQQEQKIKVQPYSCPTSAHGRLTNTQQRNAIRNVAPVVITPATEIIDLSSPPSSPTTTLEQYYSLFNPNAKCELKKIPERTWEQDSTNNAAYQGPQMSQGNSLMNGGSHVISPPPFDRANNKAPAISNTVSYSNTVPISQCMTTMYNPVPSSSVMSHSNQTQQFYNQRPSNNSQALQQPAQQHQQQLQQRQQQPKPQKLQQIITTPLVQLFCTTASVLHSSLTNTQQRNAMRNVAPVVITPATEIIDLSSPPSSPTTTLEQYSPYNPNAKWKLKKIPERTWEQDSTNNAAYQGPQMSQGNSLMNGGSHVISPLPLDRANNTAPAITNTVSYSNTVPISQYMTTMYNPVPSSSVMSHSNQMQQFYNQRPSNNSQALQQPAQQHQQQLQQRQQQQKPQKLQQIITTPLVQLFCTTASVLHSSLTNTQQRNAIRNVAPVVITPATEIIDLSSPPSSPTTTLEQYSPYNPNAKWKLKKIPERTWEQDSTNNAAYQVRKTKIDRKLINCINVKPYIYTEFMVSLVDVVIDHFLLYDIFRCAYILYNNLNITLLCGNSEQMNELRENTLVHQNKALYVYGTPMVKFKDIMYALPQLKKLLSNQKEQQQSAAWPSKRHRTS